MLFARFHASHPGFFAIMGDPAASEQYAATMSEVAAVVCYL
jgi:hypothetical protein